MKTRPWSRTRRSPNRSRFLKSTTARRTGAFTLTFQSTRSIPARPYRQGVQRPLPRKGRAHAHPPRRDRARASSASASSATAKRRREWFESLGTFDSPTAAAHCVAVTERDMDILKAHGVSVIHNPTSNLKLGSGFAPHPPDDGQGHQRDARHRRHGQQQQFKYVRGDALAEIMHDGYQTTRR